MVQRRQDLCRERYRRNPGSNARDKHISDTTCAITAAFAQCKSVKENSIGFVNENKEFAGLCTPAPIISSRAKAGIR